jgi:hypothetical protein
MGGPDGMVSDDIQEIGQSSRAMVQISVLIYQAKAILESSHNLEREIFRDLMNVSSATFTSYTIQATAGHLHLALPRGRPAWWEELLQLHPQLAVTAMSFTFRKLCPVTCFAAIWKPLHNIIDRTCFSLLSFSGAVSLLYPQ